MVHFKENIKLPRFPVFREDLPKDDVANSVPSKQVDSIIERVVQARRPDYLSRASEIESLGGRVKESFWIINAQSVEISADRIALLAQSPQVVSIDPMFSGGAAVNQLVSSRAIMATDPYYNLNLIGGYIGAIDSGVRQSHTLFTSPNRLSWVRDCVNGTSGNCGTGTGLNPNDTLDHGTAVISILSGNGNQGANNRGLSGILVDSFRAQDDAGNVPTPAFVRAFQAAVAGGDKVISTSLYQGVDENSSVSAAADAAFDAGSVVIASAGNLGPNNGTVTAPGNARRVIGVGAIDVITQVIEGYSGRGPTSDGRVKPDIMGPTNVMTAGNANDYDDTPNFNGTSAAAPHVAAAAALLRNWLIGTVPNIEPGQVYAHLIASGNRVNFDDLYGAGLLTLMTNSSWFAGKTNISSGGVIDMPISLSGAVSRIDAALWWPWSSTQHNDIDLQLISPSGTTVASSTFGTSAFEKIQYNTSTTGTYKVRIKWYSGTGTQLVYWTALQRQ